jgi:hypothetical protein
MKNQTPNKMNDTAPPLTPAQPRPSCPAPAPTSGQEEFISREELARRLKKSIRTIANWQRRRIIPFVKIENSTWFNWLDVQNHLARISASAKNPNPQPKEETHD